MSEKLSLHSNSLDGSMSGLEMREGGYGLFYENQYIKRGENFEVSKPVMNILMQANYTSNVGHCSLIVIETNGQIAWFK